MSRTIRLAGYVAVLTTLLLGIGASPALAQTFDDVGASDGFYTAVEALAQIGVVAGYPDGDFRPYEPVSRAQFAAMTARALALPAAGAQPFTDVAPDDWYAEYVAALYQAGIVGGTSATTFSPEAPIARQQAATFAVRSVVYKLALQPQEGVDPGLDPAAVETWLQGFRDRDFIVEAHRSSVADAYRLGVMSGFPDGHFLPLSAVTRAQAALILYAGLFQTLSPRPEPPTPVPAEPNYPDAVQGSSGPHVAFLEARLADLGYQPGPIDGVFDERTRHAVIAFQKVERLDRDGHVGPQVWSRIVTAERPVPRRSVSGHRVEIDLTRQVLFLVDDGWVSRILPVSTGAPGWRTPTGSFSVYNKLPYWRKSKLGLLYKPAYIHGGIAIHGSWSVPTYPASHGCIRVTVVDMDGLYPQLPYGTRVDVYY